jgi:hypothetical protein
MLTRHTQLVPTPQPYHDDYTLLQPITCAAGGFQGGPTTARQSGVVVHLVLPLDYPYPQDWILETPRG